MELYLLVYLLKYIISDGSINYTYYIGTIELTLPTTKNINIRIRIPNVIFDPSTLTNLISI